MRVGSASAGFDRFFLVEHRRLVALALAWTGDPEVARDVAQEALARAYRQWDRVVALESPGGWAHRVAVNLLIDRRRELDRRARVAGRLAGDETVELPEPAGSWVAAVRGLPDRERAAVVLHYVVDLSIADVADRLGVTVGTVKSSLAHARGKLRAALAEGSRR